MKNLWPEDLANNKLRSPITILNEQAAHLTEMTRGYVEVDVRAQDDRNTALLVYIFILRAPALGNYRTPLFTIIVNLQSLYPLKMVVTRWDEARNQEIADQWEATCEEDFESKLANLFSNRRTKNIIASILALSEGKSLPDRVITPPL